MISLGLTELVLLMMMAALWLAWRSGKSAGHAPTVVTRHAVWMPVRTVPPRSTLGSFIRGFVFVIATCITLVAGFLLVSVGFARVAFVPHTIYTPHPAPPFGMDWQPPHPVPPHVEMPHAPAAVVVPESNEIPLELQGTQSDSSTGTAEAEPVSAVTSSEVTSSEVAEVPVEAISELAPPGEVGPSEDPLAVAVTDENLPSTDAEPAPASAPSPPNEPAAPVADRVEPAAPVASPLPATDVATATQPNTADSTAANEAPSWLTGSLPSEPNTRFQVVPTASFVTRERAEEALQNEAMHALQEYAEQLAGEMHVPNRYLAQASAANQILRAQYIQVLDDAGGYRGHGLLAFTPKIREEIAQNLGESLVNARLHGAGRGMALVLAVLALSYSGLRLVGGRPSLVPERVAGGDNHGGRQVS